ncbi:MAG: Ig domain-containing protein, partial [Candidatus Methanomethylophilaceae archaeon]|nr:Ig domain-containing protein [Candidatus Methanomethylophilaceae archaeon]
RLDITDLESARSLNRAGLTWYDSEPTGIVAPKKVVVNIGETVSFEASSDVEITWAAGNPDTVLLASLKNGHTVRLTGKAIGETVLTGTSGVHTFEVAVSVVSNTTETEADGTVVKTSRSMEVLADGTVAESTLTVRTSSDGDSVETLEITYSKNGSVTGYYRKITSSDVSDEQGKAVYDINVEETSKDAGGNVTSSSESSEHRLIWTDSKGFAMTESHIVKVSGGLRTQIDSLIKATGNKTDTTETVIVTKSDGTPVSSESTRTIAKPAASAVRKESGGKVTAMAYGNIPEALALAAEIGGDFVMELRESTGAADLRAIADAGCTAEFSAAGLTVRLSASDLRQVAAKGDAVISVSIVNHSDLPANAASDLVGFTVYGVSFKAGGADMVFSSDVAVTAPYAGAAGRLAVHSVGATGGLSKISATSAGGTASFGVKEFGRIAVGEAAQKPSEPPASNSVTGVTMASSASVEVGGVITLRASVSPSNASNKALMWTSDNPSVASVDSGGSVTANGVGTATITATTVEGGYRASCTVTVKAAYTKEIDVNPSADGNVSQSQMDAAVVKVQNAKAADPSSNPVVDVESSSSTVTVPASGMSGLAEAGATLKVTTGNATVEFGSAVLGNMSKNSGTTLKIEVVKVDKGTLSESQRDKVGDGIVIDVNVTVGTTKVHQLGGKVKVSVPYELKPGQDAGNLKVWYLNDNGTLEEIPCTYDAKSKTVVFETGHFSKFAVMYAETAVDDTAPATDWTIIAIVAVVLVLAIAVAGVMFRRRSAV